MRKTFELHVNSLYNEEAEQAVRVMDKLVRRFYNVHGGKRIYSGRGAGDEWYIFVEYTADWDDTGLWPGLDDIRRAYFHKMARIDPYDDITRRVFIRKDWSK